MGSAGEDRACWRPRGDWPSPGRQGRRSRSYSIELPCVNATGLGPGTHLPVGHRLPWSWVALQPAHGCHEPKTTPQRRSRVQAPSCHTSISQAMGVPAAKGLPPRQHLLSAGVPGPTQEPCSASAVVFRPCRVGCFMKPVRVFIRLLFCLLSKNSSGGEG